MRPSVFLLLYQTDNYTYSVNDPIILDSVSVAASIFELGLLRCLPAFAGVLCLVCSLRLVHCLLLLFVLILASCLYCCVLSRLVCSL